MLVFAVRDVKAGVFGTPWFARTRGVAIRNFCGAVGNPEHEWSKFAEDYSLYFVGEWREELGALVPSEPIQLMTASAALAAASKVA